MSLDKSLDFRRELLSERAYNIIKRAIIRCELGPGSLITEAKLVARYSLGRAAVRAALNRLYQDRLVQPEARRGYQIAPITIKNVRDLFAVRLLLEPPAAELAARRADEAVLRQLKQLLEEMSQSARYRPGDCASAETFLQANTKFHFTVVAASGNERLANSVVGLLEEMERLFHLGLMVRDRNDEMYHEHNDLMEALLTGDETRAREVADEQIRAAERMVIDALISSPGIESVNLASTGL